WADYRGRWTEFAGSATDGGLSNGPAESVESSIAAAAAGQFVAWADSRSGLFEVFAALHTAAGGRQLAGSAHGRRPRGAPAGGAPGPSLAWAASGSPVVAYTVLHGLASDIAVARFDATAGGGAGAWVALGNSLAPAGISDTGMADDAEIVETQDGPVVAWLDRSGGVGKIVVKQFRGGSWVPLGGRLP